MSLSPKSARPSPFASPGEVEDDDSIRCPKCGYVQTVAGYDSARVYDEGRHLLSCHHCDFDFEIRTAVTITFTSPAMGKTLDDE